MADTPSPPTFASCGHADLHMPEPMILSPASAAQLLLYIISNHTYPLTLVVGSTKEEFLRVLVRHVEASRVQKIVGTQAMNAHPLLAASLFQIAVAKHIRLLFTPTVSHLRAYLSVFSPLDSKVSSPPVYNEAAASAGSRWLVVYGMFNIHRNTSEWNSQGIMSSLSVLVDAASRAGFRPVIVEPHPEDPSIEEDADATTPGEADRDYDAQDYLQKIRAEQVPLLGYKQSSDVHLSKRSVSLGRVAERWFHYFRMQWSEETNAGDGEIEREYTSQENLAMTQADE
ncbi:uncharacterized protein BROUX77_006684 [Berkeleyomyces rouxiae]|uniref:uncharacterized protein n=1 Tax=Berkeleyomyces rouxiae TaxID=2035830 RepID=UPI003B81105C